MNCNLDLVEKYLKKEFPYVVKIKSLVESSPVVSFSGTTHNVAPNFDMKIFIKDCIKRKLKLRNKSKGFNRKKNQKHKKNLHDYLYNLIK